MAYGLKSSSCDPLITKEDSIWKVELPDLFGRAGCICTILIAIVLSSSLSPLFFVKCSAQFFNQPLWEQKAGGSQGKTFERLYSQTNKKYEKVIITFFSGHVTLVSVIAEYSSLDLVKKF